MRCRQEGKIVRNWNMSNPVVLITGALSGIGRAAAVAFAKKGAKVVIAGRRDEAGKALVTELRSFGSEAEFINVDVRKEDDVRALVDKTIARFGRLDVAVNNAGTEGQVGPITDQTAESYAATFDTTVPGVVLSMKHEVRVMQGQGSGSIINISSTYGHEGAAGASIYDWGGALAMDWARRHPDAMRGIVYFETLVRSRTWDEMDQSARNLFERLRSPEGEELVLKDNVFVEKLFPARILRSLSEAEMAIYRRPYLRPGEDRRPTLQFPREIPVDSAPEHTAQIVKAYGDWMVMNDIPKLLITGDPGAVLTGSLLEYCRTWRNQEELTVRGRHFLQEDSPDEIGGAIARWLVRLPLSRSTDEI
jgi:NAD(P)-dependent dehydrogenase (short-subunit alcohol dehydrogenase family)